MDEKCRGAYQAEGKPRITSGKECDRQDRRPTPPGEGMDRHTPCGIDRDGRVHLRSVYRLKCRSLDERPWSLDFAATFLRWVAVDATDESRRCCSDLRGSG